MTFEDQVRALCAQAAVYQGYEQRQRLAGMALAVVSSDRSYPAQLTRALVEQSCAERSSLRVLVTDRQTDPNLIPPEFDVARYGLGALLCALEAAGLWGIYDSDYDNWQLLDPGSGLGLHLMARPGGVPPWEAACPLRNFVHWTAVQQGRRLLHAGTLGLAGRGVLLAGPGGAGKSGTVLAGICHGLQSVGDDYILLDPGPAPVTAWPVMRLMKQDQRGLERLGLFAQSGNFGAPNWQSKYEFDFNALIPGSRAQSLQINAVLLPKLSGAPRSRLLPASARDVIFALLPNNLQQLPGAARQAMSVVAGLARDLPGYHLELSAEPAEIAATLRDFLQKGTSCA